MGDRWHSLISNPDALDALIGGLSTIVAAVLATLTGVLTYWLTQKRERRKEREERKAEIERSEAARKERVDDMVRALHAEILSAVLQTDKQLSAEEVRYALADDTPFGVADRTNFVYEKMVGEISILPSPVIHPVVAYYRAAEQGNLLIAAMNEWRFLALSPAEKRKFISGYIGVNQLAFDRGRHALSALDAYFEGSSNTGVKNELAISREELEKSTQETFDKVAAAIAKATPRQHAGASNQGNNRPAHNALRSPKKIRSKKG